MRDMFIAPGWREKISGRKGFRAIGLAATASLFLCCGASPAAPVEPCRRVVMMGEVNAGHSWSQSFGRGWVFRLLPIKSGEEGYSGWDLAVDRAGGAGFPDALLLATPPYDSISQREVGTTFGLRAQDAIGWNPRDFRFLMDSASLRKAQRLYFKLRSDNEASQHDHAATARTGDSNKAGELSAASKSLMDLSAHSDAGQFRILDARLTPGTANPLPYAQNWAMQQRNTPQTIVPTDSPTPYGKLESLKFEITLWLPAGWRTPKSLESTPSQCR